MTTNHVADIEKWAADIAGSNKQAQRSLILGWSSFPGKDGGNITIGGRSLRQVSPGWLMQIWRRARKAHANWVSMPSLFDVAKVEPARMPDWPENHPENLPF